MNRAYIKLGDKSQCDLQLSDLLSTPGILRKEGKTMFKAECCEL